VRLLEAGEDLPPHAQAQAAAIAAFAASGRARWGALGPPSWGGWGPGHGAGWGLPLPSRGGVGGRLDSLEASVGSVNACVPEDEEGVTAVSRPVSVLRPSMVSRLSETSGSRARASDRLLEYDILVG
jgi:hypothetical protein